MLKSSLPSRIWCTTAFLDWNTKHISPLSNPTTSISIHCVMPLPSTTAMEESLDHYLVLNGVSNGFIIGFVLCLLRRRQTVAPKWLFLQSWHIDTATGILSRSAGSHQEGSFPYWILWKHLPYGKQEKEKNNNVVKISKKTKKIPKWMNMQFSKK